LSSVGATTCRMANSRRFPWRLSVRSAHFVAQKKRGRSGLQSACDELIDKGAIITGE
jgi:hypothetical protein